MWLNNELLNYADSRRHIFYYAMAILQVADSSKLPTVLDREADYISTLPDVTEKEMLLISKAYRELAGNTAKAEAVDKQIAVRFPNGMKAKGKEDVSFF
ncbi:c-di-GMP-binding flagellar brake protein YcgR [Filimonas zeae]|uniref:Uncharacterized protein n=1 Tax=Filimonas zeae TaxID=1737353 RepID=A0A917MTZ9_9BACT|nr:hypothetical protein [Filimonas zeae]MDR6339413.1 c-di-GMP-binding flagellar brake protein YcgR [Filimonas zeae]GGH63709.1 hypothetical protein GCM10011379_14920 [Filimonas zeae]